MSWILDDDTAYHVSCGCGAKRKTRGGALRPFHSYEQKGETVQYGNFTCQACGGSQLLRLDSPKIEPYKPRVPKTQYIGIHELEYRGNWVLGYRPTNDRKAIDKWKAETLGCINVLDAKVYQITEA